MMRVLFITLAIAALATPALSADRFSGYYNRECGTRHVCDLRIDRTGPTRWRVTWEPFVWRGDSKPVCRREFSAQIGGPAGTFIDGIAHGKVGGGLVGIVDRGLGKLEVRTDGGCAGILMGGTYEAVGD
ncbi:hypothetical protein [Jiella pacifica]|uniref:DUF2147 domain-containing protein n=1 Tax=Jiella pacifica TaxID=2696469 RepID=A0A6N9T814_9HYPH|nr:hypothetical protein [Jiella pacifica]NDW07361.1 hypothetical protein [Jiella pacifica]